MPSIYHLADIGSAGPNAISEDFSTIAGDDFDGRMSFEPVRQRASIAIGKEIDNLVYLQIDDHRSVPPSTAPSPLVDANDTRRYARRNVAGANEPHEGIGARGHPKPAGKPFARFSSERQTQMALDLSQSFGTTGGRARSNAEPLGECSSAAVRVPTDETANLNAKADRLSLPWKITESSSVTAMVGVREFSTIRANRLGSPNASMNDNPIGRVHDINDADRVGDERKEAAGHWSVLDSLLI